MTYSGLFERGSKSSIFFSRSWFENLSRTALDPQQELILYGLEEETCPKALLMASSGANGQGYPRTLSGLSNFYSMEFAPLLNADSDSQLAVLGALTEALGRKRPHWDILRLEALDPTTSMFEHLLQALRRTGWIAHTSCQFANWYQSVEHTSYEEYRRGLPSGIRRLDRKFDEASNHRFDLTSGPHGLQKAVQDYEEVYTRSWKTPERYPAFIPGFLRCAAEMGSLRLGLLYVDDQPVAGQIWLVNCGRATIYKIAYDQSYKNLGVGSMLSMRMFRHVIDVDKVREVDYGSGDDSYKKTWMSSRRERWSLEAFNSRTACGLLWAATYASKRVAKAHFKKE